MPPLAHDGGDVIGRQSSLPRFRKAVCLDQLWRALRNASRRLRSRLKRCNIPSRNAPALLVLVVAPDLRRLTLRGRQDRGRSHSARHYLFPKRHGPQPRSPWIKRLGNPSDQPGRKRRGLSLATAGPPRKQPLMCLLSPHSALGAEESVPAISVLPVCSQSLEMFQPRGRYRPSAQSFPENAGPFGSGFAGT